MRRSRVDLLGI